MEESVRTYLRMNGIRADEALERAIVEQDSHAAYDALSRLDHREENKKKEEEDENPYTSRLFVCPKCGTNETRTKLVQTRRGDEGATMFVECKNGHRFKQD